MLINFSPCRSNFKGLPIFSNWSEPRKTIVLESVFPTGRGFHFLGPGVYQILSQGFQLPTSLPPRFQVLASRIPDSLQRYYSIWVPGSLFAGLGNPAFESGILVPLVRGSSSWVRPGASSLVGAIQVRFWIRDPIPICFVWTPFSAPVSEL
jgi:hypothetical protein